MRINEILTEGLSPIVYHYTNIFAGEKIVTDGVFELSSTLGSVEEQYAPPGYPYFLSTARTKTGGYHQKIGPRSAVMFVMDGNWYNQRYSAKPVDYWLNRDPKNAYGRAHEAEDRLFSKTPTIPIGGVTSVHVLLKNEKPEPKHISLVRKLLVGAKRRDIPAYFYTDEGAWRRLDTTQTGDIGVLKTIDSEKRKPYIPSYIRRSVLESWLELIGAQKENQLSKEANNIKYGLRYHWDNPFYLKAKSQELENDFSNARKPSSGVDRENATKIIAFMRQKKLNTVFDLVNWLATKWKDR
jgi:hypothetical protein